MLLLAASWTWGNPWMLGFAAASLLPLLIHFWSRQRFVQRRFAAFEFLERAYRQQSRRLALEHWLLLALRMLALGLLAIALADPRWTASATTDDDLGPRAGTLWVLVVDNSYSMDARQQGSSRLAMARQQLSDWLTEFPAGDAAVLVTMGQQVDVLIGEPVFDSGELQTLVDQIALSPGAARLAPTCARISQLLDTTRQVRPSLRQARVLFITDLGASTWAALEQETLRRQLREIDEEAPVSLWNVTLETAEDASQKAIVGVDVESSWGVAGQPIEFAVRVSGCRVPRGSAYRLEVRVDGRQWQERRLEWPADQEQVIPFEITFPEPGQKRLEFRLSPDALPFDNVWYLTLDVRPRLQVLLAGPSREATRTLAAALLPAPEFNPALQLIRVSDLELAGVELEEYDAIVLHDLSRLDTRMTEALGEFLRRGGGVIVSTGPRTRPQAWRQTLRDWTAQEPPRWASEPARGDFRIDPLEYQHPILRAFRGFPEAGLLTVPIARYWPLQIEGFAAENSSPAVNSSPAENSFAAEEPNDRPSKEAPLRRVLNFANGDPLMLEWHLGRGRCLLSTTPLSAAATAVGPASDGEWNAWPAWPSYVPLVQELLTRSVVADLTARNTRVGEILRWESLQQQTQPPRVVLPSGRQVEATRDERRDSTQWQFPSPTETGWYRLETAEMSRGAPFANPLRWAVNHQGEDSCLESVEPEQLPPFVERLETLGQESPQETTAARSTPLYPGLLLSLLVLSFVELAVARRQGRAALAVSRERSSIGHNEGPAQRTPMAEQETSRRATPDWNSSGQTAHGTAAQRFLQRTQRRRS